MRRARVDWALMAACVGVLVWSVGPASADPLPGQVLKFQQLPMIHSQIEGQIYNGHDEVSTAALTFFDPGPGPGSGTYRYETDPFGLQWMADDFADRSLGPIVHVKWWGSYLKNGPVDRFLIEILSDVPASESNQHSRPGNILWGQVVTKTTTPTLPPGSGLYHEVLVGPTASDPEPVFYYNAELRPSHFIQDPDTVYWLKIVALVDTVDNEPVAIWGWHNRDYTIFDPYASVPGAVPPATFPPLAGVSGEYDDGDLPDGQDIWHFQDDAVAGTGLVLDAAEAGPEFVQITGLQENVLTSAPQNYIDGVDGPGPGPVFEGIAVHSKDLAFELYTVPEPGSALLIGLGGVLVAAARRRKGL